MNPLITLSTPGGRGPLLVLSPHLDDAVISVGGVIGRAVAEGRNVTVASLYTSAPRRCEVPQRFRRLLTYERRTQEDADAMKSLGATPLWLGFPERATRQPSLGWKLDVFKMPSPPTLQHFANLAAIQEQILALVAAMPGVTVLAPFAVGAHIDHVETFLAALLIMLRTPDAATLARFQFYEDAYSFSARARRRHFAARLYQWKPWESPVWGSLRATVMLATMGRAARGPLLSAYLSNEASGLAWRCTPVCVSGFEGAKLHAWSLYRSQVARLGGMKVWEHMIPRYHSFWGGAEPLWQADTFMGTVDQRTLSNRRDGTRSPGGGERGGRVHGSRDIAIGGEPNPGPSTVCGVHVQFRRAPAGLC